MSTPIKVSNTVKSTRYGMGRVSHLSGIGNNTEIEITYNDGTVQYYSYNGKNLNGDMSESVRVNVVGNITSLNGAYRTTVKLGINLKQPTKNIY